MTGMRRLLVLAAVGLLGAAPAAAQSDHPNPFSQPRQELRRERGPSRHEARAPRARVHRGRMHTHQMHRLHRYRMHHRLNRQRPDRHRVDRERLHQRRQHAHMLERRGERLERQGHPRAGRIWKQRGRRLERRGEI